ncbi:MAG: tetratricopeptide repeat protein [Parvibaculum sp.]
MTTKRNVVNRPKSKARVLEQPDRYRMLFMMILGCLLAAMVFVVRAAGASDEVVSRGPDEASGQDLYQRGYYEEAIGEWTKAVEEKGDTGAAFRLGEEYFDAKVVTRDIETSLKYLRLGADGGDARAQQDLATMYDNGWGVTKDTDEAAKWYLAAALQGNAVAQYNIATMYETGTGVEQDIEKAYMYYLLAIEGGFRHFATTELENVSQNMTAQQIKDATVMARQFKPVGQNIEDQDG